MQLSLRTYFERNNHAMYFSFSRQRTLLSQFHVLFFLYVMYSSFSISCTLLSLCNVLFFLHFMYSSFSMQCTLLLYVMYSILSPFHVLFFLYVMYSSFSISCTQFFLHDPIRNNKFLFPEYYYRFKCFWRLAVF